MEMIQEYWRRFEESAIVFVNKFRNNLFLKIQITFLAVLLLIAVLDIVSLSLISYHVSEDTADTIFTQLGNALLKDAPTPSFTILEQEGTLESIRSYYLLIIGAINITGVIMLGVLASKIVLEPTRDAINAQKNFIGYTAHELRTPLSVARTNIEATLLGKTNISKAECIEELERTLIELDGLAGIINNLVVLNTVTNLEPAEYKQYDLHPIIDEITATYKEHIANKHIVFHTETTPNLFVWGNRNALKQMIGNIVGNAINFTPEHGTVTLHAKQLSTRYMRLTLEDTGIGIPQQELQYIFKPFYRASTTHGRNDGGTGLGLSIVRELVRLHLGRIGIKSEVNKGTTITIDLPILKHTNRFTRSKTLNDQHNTVTYNYSREKDITSL